MRLEILICTVRVWCLCFPGCEVEEENLQFPDAELIKNYVMVFYLDEFC